MHIRELCAYALTSKEASAILGCSAKQIRKLYRAGELRGYPITASGALRQEFRIFDEAPAEYQKRRENEGCGPKKPESASRRQSKSRVAGVPGRADLTDWLK